jgi:hypothetical protein
MPSSALSLTDLAELRLQSISFFLLLFVLSVVFVRFLWNYLQKDFPTLPRLGFGSAFGLVALWGLLFVVVLTMISGARELLTPGAWAKQGWTYRLARDQPSTSPPTDDRERTRRQKIEELRFALWDHARRQGQFPSTPAESDIPSERWQVPDASGMRYIYVGARRDRVAPLAYEPAIFGTDRYVLFTNGDVRLLGPGELDRALEGGKR